MKARAAAPRTWFLALHAGASGRRLATPEAAGTISESKLPAPYNPRSVESRQRFI